MRITRSIVLSVVLALSFGSAGAAVAALCTVPKTVEGEWDPVTRRCHVTIFCNPPQEVIIWSWSHDDTTCSVKYSCCLDPQGSF